MFTGIVTKGTVLSAERRGELLRMRIAAPHLWRFKKGESVAVSGVCSTVIATAKNTASFEYMPETLRLTTLGQFTKGSSVNLERSLKMSDRLHGHFVQGHVEGCGVVSSIVSAAGYMVTIVPPKELLPYIVEKGSITIDGVSLTVAARTIDSLSVALIPFTLEETTLGSLKIGDTVQIETDMLARHVAQLMKS